MFFKKNYKFFIIIFFLLIFLAYVTNITLIPDNIILFNNDRIDLKTIFGVKLEDAIQVDASLDEQKKINGETERKYNLSLLGFNIKTVTANVVENTKVIPLGNIAGIKLYTNGVLVVGMSEITGEDNRTYKPYEGTGIEIGDSILKINNKEVNNTEELIECVSKTKGEMINITYSRDGNIQQTSIAPVKTSSNTYKIGIWVRDAAAGIGTLSFYNTKTKSVVLLGHGIQDIDTEELVEISSGELVTANVLNIKKGEENNPGKISGNIENSETIGEIYKNTEFGVYAQNINENKLDIQNKQEMEVASRNEITTGKATVICTLDDGIQKEYEVQIEKIYANNYKDNRSMIVKVTDKELIEKTGGIIQGMSGSPVIQNGKVIGALTHVFVSSPTKGYAVFADELIE